MSEKQETQDSVGWNSLIRLLKLTSIFGSYVWSRTIWILQELSLVWNNSHPFRFWKVYSHKIYFIYRFAYIIFRAIVINKG